MIEVNHRLAKKMKHQFIDLVGNVKALVGMNGRVYIYASEMSNETEYFAEDAKQIAKMKESIAVTE